MEQQGIGIELPSHPLPVFQDRPVPVRASGTPSPVLQVNCPQFSLLSQFSKHLIVRGRGEQDGKRMGGRSDLEKEGSREHEGKWSQSSDCHPSVPGTHGSLILEVTSGSGSLDPLAIFTRFWWVDQI